MRKCQMCGKDRQEDGFELQFIDNDGKEYYVCSECNKAITSIAENDENADEAVKYAYGCFQNCHDKILTQWLNDTLSSYYSDKEETIAADEAENKKSTIWISSLRRIYKVAFFGIIFIGIIACAMLEDINIGLGILAPSVSILVSVLVVGFAIVFLDMANDIHQIRNLLEKQNKRDN